MGRLGVDTDKGELEDAACALELEVILADSDVRHGHVELGAACELAQDVDVVRDTRVLHCSHQVSCRKQDETYSMCVSVCTHVRRCPSSCAT